MSTGEVEATFLIADLSGYTALTEVHGNAQAAQIIHRYVALAEAAIASGVRLVERVGDALLFVGDAGAVVETAVRLREAVDAEPLFPTVRAGIHTGTVFAEGGRYYGGALNLTARVAAHAGTGQILCTAPAAAVTKPPAGVAFRPLGTVRFKNIAGTVELFEVVTARQQDEANVVDPVCRMQVRPDTAPARLTVASRDYYFCSLECARLFAQRPADYSGGADAM